MVLSLNYFTPSGMTSITRTSSASPVRPDLICFALLWLAEHAVWLDPTTERYVRGPGVAAPEWWREIGFTKGWGQSLLGSKRAGGNRRHGYWD